MDIGISNSKLRIKIFETKSHIETKNLGYNIGMKLKKGVVLCLVGELGAGKTTFIQGIAQGLDIQDNPTSPSFTLINEYKGRIPLYHFDLWRINGSNDLEDIGYKEYFFGKGVTVVEWADRIKEIWPNNRIEIYIEYKMKNNRKIKIFDFTGIL